jgi:hypothetical protein
MMTFPTEWEVIKVMFQTTNQYSYFDWFLKTTYNNWWASPCGFHNGERTNVLASGLAQCGIIQ